MAGGMERRTGSGLGNGEPPRVRSSVQGLTAPGSAAQGLEQSTRAVASATALVVGCGIMAAPNPTCHQVGQPGGSVSDSQ
jgi:hypothetical protein